MDRSPREVAVRLLSEKGGASRSSLLDALRDPRDRALAIELVSGAIKWRRLIDRELARMSTRPLDKISPRLLSALRVGAFQLLFTGMPAYAAVNTAVGCLNGPGERAFANAVLRGVSRCLGHVELPSIDHDEVLYGALRYSYPDWIASLFIERFGLSSALALLDLGNRPALLTLRVNDLRVTAEAYLKMLRERGIEAELGAQDVAVKLKRGADVASLPGYREGLFAVQDEGAIAVGEVVAPAPSEEVWDVCAAPGGKTTHLAQMMKGSGRVLATDVNEERAAMVTENASRLGLENIEVRVLDATRADLGRSFDRILIDAPCSGLGTIRRNPDLRWNHRPDDIPKMAERQALLLEAAVKHLRAGGVLVYSTCTLTKEENEGVFSEFLKKHPELAPDDPAGPSGQGTKRLFAGPPFAGPGYRYILPHLSGTDGFFVARAVKRG